MHRDLRRLASGTHDLIVVGGGLHGACIAWDATLRGLRVALVERDDFGAATSANSLRIVHGGLRYLARGDLRRMRESIRERSALLRIAPTLVEPLPVLVPTTGQGTRGRLAFAAALRLNDLCSPNRNRGLDAAHRVPDGRLVSLEECRRLFPAFPAEGASGGALWHDARLTHPERLTLAFVRAAAREGALVANHCALQRVLTDGGTVQGVAAADRLGGGGVEIHGRAVVVAAGPWTASLSGADPARLPHAFALNVVIGRRLADVAVGRPGGDGRRRRIRSSAAAGSCFSRHRSGRRCSGPGTPPPREQATRSWLARGSAALLGEFRAACPALELDAGDIVGYQWGWLPLKAGRERGRPDALADRPRVLEHRAGGWGGQYVFGRRRKIHHRAQRCRGRDRPGHGRAGAELRCPAGRPRPVWTRARSSRPPWTRACAERCGKRWPFTCRTCSGAYRPASDAEASPEVAAVAGLAAAELGWTDQRKDAEIDALKRSTRTPGSVPEPTA